MAILDLSISQRLDIKYTLGDTFRFDIDVDDANGDDYDFTSCTALMQIKENDTDTTALIELSTTNTKITLTSGNIAFLESSANMIAALEAKEYVYDLQITKANGDIQTWLYGDLIVEQDTTR